jgi:hypothetical protein
MNSLTGATWGRGSKETDTAGPPAYGVADTLEEALQGAETFLARFDLEQVITGARADEALSLVESGELALCGGAPDVPTDAEVMGTALEG